jgi:hypothetical protein
MYEWTDPDTGDVYEIDYIVTQTEAEGPEYFEYRLKTLGGGGDGAPGYGPWRNWRKLPPFALDPEVAQIASDHFFGRPQKTVIQEIEVPAFVAKAAKCNTEVLGGRIVATNWGTNPSITIRWG